MKKRSKKAQHNLLKHDSENLLGSYLNDIRKFPLLTREEEIQAAKDAAKGNKKAKDKLVNSIVQHLKLDEPGNGVLFVLDISEAYGLKLD